MLIDLFQGSSCFFSLSGMASINISATIRVNQNSTETQEGIISKYNIAHSLGCFGNIKLEFGSQHQGARYYSPLLPGVHT